jgi:soluble lytic murein transglycosylase-like protein
MATLRILAATLAALALPGVASAPGEDLLPPPLQTLSEPPELAALDRPVAQAIVAFIRAVNPDVPAPRATALTATILAASEARGLDPLLLTGIIAQETHFRADVQSCLGRGCDLGVAQVNWETWGAARGLDRHRLIHDDGYNVGVAADILADLRRRHGGEGGRWWTRYHDRRPERRTEYAERVLAHAPVLLGSL